MSWCPQPRGSPYLSIRPTLEGRRLRAGTLNRLLASLGCILQFYDASTSKEIDAAYATLVRERPDALFVAPDTLFTSRRVQLTALAARHALPAIYSVRAFADAGGLMSYGTSFTDMNRQVGPLCWPHPQRREARRLAGMQATKFELVINLQTARSLGSRCRRRCSPAPTR